MVSEKEQVIKKILKYDLIDQVDTSELIKDRDALMKLKTVCFIEDDTGKFDFNV